MALAASSICEIDITRKALKSLSQKGYGETYISGSPLWDKVVCNSSAYPPCAGRVKFCFFFRVGSPSSLRGLSASRFLGRQDNPPLSFQFKEKLRTSYTLKGPKDALGRGVPSTPVFPLLFFMEPQAQAVRPGFFGKGGHSPRFLVVGNPL